MKKIILFLSALSIMFLSSCTEDEVSIGGREAVMFTKRTANFPVFSDPLISFTDVEIAVTNISNVDRVYSVSVDLVNTTATTDMYSIASTSVTIPAGSRFGYLRITGDYDEVGVQEYDLVLNLNETLDNLVVDRASTTLVMKQGCATNPVTLTATFDAYPEETSWELTDSSGATIASGSGYAAGSNPSFVEDYCLSAGTYTLTVLDSYGDGISPGGFTLTNSTTNAIIGTAISGNFGFGTSITFTLP